MLNDIEFLASSATLISTDGGSPVRFTLTNLSNEQITLHWIDRDGVSKPYAALGYGQFHHQGTFVTHAWEIKSVSGKIHYKFMPTHAGSITINPAGEPSFADHSEQVFTTTAGLWSTAQGFGLIDVAKSLGVDEVPGLSMAGQNNHMALNAINAPAAWAAGITGKGVKVAVIDAGIADHYEIAGKIVAGHDFYDKDPLPAPDAGPYIDHALGVAAIIAASHEPRAGRDTMGVAPDASLINVRVGSSTFGSSTDRMAAGIRYAVDQGAKVICMPLQADGGSDPALADAVHYAFQKNVVTVIIGGNYSNYGPTGPAMIAQQFKGEVIDVGNFNIAAGSKFDSSNMPGADPFPWVMAGSSGWVPNTAGGYSYWSDGGTSFAGPYVAGLAALLWQQNPQATATEIMNKILAGAGLGDSAATAQVPHFIGTGANEHVDAVSGGVIDGGAGIDVARFTGHRADFDLAATSDGFAVVNKADNTVVLLTDVERVVFADTAVALDVGTDGHVGEVFRLYQAAFNRAPLKSGLGYWTEAMDDGMSLSQVAFSFTQSAEFKQLYGANPTDAELVNALFMNVLHRPPKQAGFDFWMKALESGVARHDVLVGLSESGENQANIAEIIGSGVEYTPYIS